MSSGLPTIGCPNIQTPIFKASQAKQNKIIGLEVKANVILLFPGSGHKFVNAESKNKMYRVSYCLKTLRFSMCSPARHKVLEPKWLRKSTIPTRET